MGRDAAALRRFSESTGLNIVMATGFYLEPTHPPEVERMSTHRLAEEIERDLLTCADGTAIRAGVIGEIGVSSGFSAAERKSREAAAAAQARTGVPLSCRAGSGTGIGCSISRTRRRDVDGRSPGS